MAEGPVSERVLEFLVARGGRVRDGELTEQFRGFLEEGDPAIRAERCAEWKAALKACAVVKQEKGLRFLVLKKKLRHLLGAERAARDAVREDPLPAPPPLHHADAQQQPQQEEEVKVDEMDDEGEEVKVDEQQQEEEDETASRDGSESPAVAPKGAGGEAEVAQEVAQEEVDKQEELEEREQKEEVMEADETGEEEAAAGGGAPDASSGSCEGAGGGAQGPPIGGQEPASASSDTVSEQSEQLQSACSRAETEQEDVGSVTASSVTSLFAHTQLAPLERRWMREASACCAHTLRQLLAQEPGLASHRDFTSGFTALHWAAKHGSVEVATLVAEAGVDVNARSHGGYTALHVATIHSREDMVELLITTLRVRQDVRDYSGRLAWHYAAAGWHGAPARTHGAARHGDAAAAGTAVPNTPSRSDKRSSRQLAGAFPGLLPNRAGVPCGPGASAGAPPGNRASWGGSQPPRGRGAAGRRRWGSAEDLVEEEEDRDPPAAKPDRKSSK